MKRTFTVTMLEDGAVVRVRTVVRTHSQIVAQIAAQCPGVEPVTTCEETISASGRCTATGIPVVTFTRGNAAIRITVG